MAENKYRYLKNKYRLDRLIAKGGMSSVYLCTNIELGNQWIAKHIDKRYNGLIYEEQILKKLNHISLPKIVDICEDESGIFIIENYIEGISLQRKLECVGKLKVDKVIDYSMQLCEVLQYLHNLKPSAIIHKDLKPSNIIITEYDRLVLIDFGISQLQGGSLEELKAGTDAYASPEQLTDGRKADGRWDIYSLGVIICQMLTGQLPGRYQRNADKTPAIYERLMEIGEKCSRFIVEERYQKIEDVRKELLNLRNKSISIEENGKIKVKMILIIITILSIINYICLFLGLFVFKG